MGDETICATLEKILWPQKHSSTATRADVVPGTPLGNLIPLASVLYRFQIIKRVIKFHFGRSRALITYH